MKLSQLKALVAALELSKPDKSDPEVICYNPSTGKEFNLLDIPEKELSMYLIKLVEGYLYEIPISEI